MVSPASADVLVSNLGQSDQGLGALAQFDQGQAFTTGDDEAGYTLNSVEVQFGLVSAVVSYGVAIWSSDEEVAPSADTDTLDEPHTRLGALSCPLSVSATDAVYDCTTTGIDLEAETTYLFVIDSSYTLNNRLRNTGSDSQDAGAASGWSIENSSIFRGITGVQTWGTWPQSKKIRINGTAKSSGTNSAPVFSATTLTRSMREDHAPGTGIGTSIPEATDADAGDTLTYSMEGTDADSFTFNATTLFISTKAGENYDHEAKSSYSVTIRVSDGTDSDTVAVTINVTDVDEPPSAPAAPSRLGDRQLDDEPGRELDGAGERRQAADRELRPALPQGHERGASATARRTGRGRARRSRAWTRAATIRCRCGRPTTRATAPGRPPAPAAPAARRTARRCSPPPR